MSLKGHVTNLRTRRGSGETYLEAENTADEEQDDEDQADVAESSDLVLVREVIRLRGDQLKKHKRVFASVSSVRGSAGRTNAAFRTSCCR